MVEPLEMKARRNQYGEIELPDRPEDGVPPGLLHELERWVYGPDSLIGMERAGSIGDLPLCSGRLGGPYHQRRNS